MVVFLIFGTVVGSGFSSGKEIMVFFSRFGSMSYLYIILAGILFFCLFYFFLTVGGRIVRKLERNSFFNFIIILISVVYCASMFAGIESLFGYFPQWLYAILILLLIVGSFCVVHKGVGGLEKVNIFLMPISAIVFLCILLSLCLVNTNSLSISFEWAGFLYCPLYVSLNSAMSGIVISKAGSNITKKQTFFISLFSSLLIVVFLLLGNFVLLQNVESFFSDMPFLFLSQNNTVLFALTFIVILTGCFTTLISMCYTIKNACKDKIKNDKFSTLVAVVLPFSVSSFGFSHIVSNLYPLSSVLGIFILIYFLFEIKKA